MENIFYLDAKNGIEKFLMQEFDTCPTKLRNRFLTFFTNLIRYEEEGEKLHPQILLTNNIDSISRLIPNIYKVNLFNDENENLFDNRMKALMPFTAEDWWIYINASAKEDEIAYGIVKTTGSIKDPNFREQVFSNFKLKDKADKLDLVLVEPYSDYVVNLSSLSGKELNINFSFSQGLYTANANEEIAKFTEASFSKLKTTSKKLEEIKNMFTQIFKTVTKKVHGAICVVIDKDYKDKKLFEDGVWLREPISFSKLFLNSKSYSEPKLDAVAGLFITMLNFDGITIIDNTGKIRAYNVFIETSLEKTKNVIGGARKRAAYTIINSRRTKIVGVYFQSHEGEIFYSDVKGYKSRKRAEKKEETQKIDKVSGKQDNNITDNATNNNEKENLPTNQEEDLKNDIVNQKVEQENLIDNNDKDSNENILKISSENIGMTGQTINIIINEEKQDANDNNNQDINTDNQDKNIDNNQDINDNDNNQDIDIDNN